MIHEHLYSKSTYKSAEEKMYYLHVKIIEMGLYIFISNCKLKTSESYDHSY